ncbi:MAG: helix-turn-helix domain-containing protein [Cognatishimia sp.]|nr:helix-turn-helix domain-containing protein [Cognatishimia sp.]
MKLNDFLSQTGTTKSAFAELIGTTTATISRIGDGLVVPRRDLLERIYKATNGLVTPNDLTGLHAPSSDAAIDDNSARKNQETHE